MKINTGTQYKIAAGSANMKYCDQWIRLNMVIDFIQWVPKIHSILFSPDYQ